MPTLIGICERSGVEFCNCEFVRLPKNVSFYKESNIARINHLKQPFCGGKGQKVKFFAWHCTCGHLHSPLSLMAPGGQVVTHFLESVFSNSSSGQLLRHFFPDESIISFAPHEVTHDFSSLLINSPFPQFVTHSSPAVMKNKGSVHVHHLHPWISSKNDIYR